MVGGEPMSEQSPAREKLDALIAEASAFSEYNIDTDDAFRRIIALAHDVEAELKEAQEERGRQTTIAETNQRQLDKVDEALPRWEGTGRGRIETIDNLTAERDEAQQAQARGKAALGFYADKGNWDIEVNRYGEPNCGAYDDEGELARDALSATGWPDVVVRLIEILSAFGCQDVQHKPAEYVSQDMATDAGDPTMAGTLLRGEIHEPCGVCPVCTILAEVGE